MTGPEPQLLTEGEADEYVSALTDHPLAAELGYSYAKVEVPGVPADEPRRFALKVSAS